MSIKRVYHRADFDSSLDGQARLNFIDQQFADCASNGIDGVIIGHGGESVWILEGSPQAVDNKVSELVNAQELESNETILSEDLASGCGQLASHTDKDPRDTD